MAIPMLSAARRVRVGLRLARLARALLYGPLLLGLVAVGLFAAGVRVGRETGPHSVVVVPAEAPGPETSPAASVMAAASATAASASRAVPARAAGAAMAEWRAESAEGDGRLDLNAATAEELERLPGIGPVIARRIVEFRQAHGPFAMVDDLIEVPGIGARTLEKLRPLVRVGS